MPGTGIADWERRLGRFPAQGTFDGEEIAGLPEPVQRHLTAAIRSDSALTTAVGLKMHGRIKVGRWLPFRARQALSPHEGFRAEAAVVAHREMTAIDRSPLTKVQA